MIEYFNEDCMIGMARKNRRDKSNGMQGGRIMREIKFRGYSEDLDKWVYGDLLQYRVLPIIFDEECEQHECFHSSIGQSTGLFDKNGVEVYEGDVVKHNGNMKSTMKFVEEEAGFKLINKTLGMMHVSKEYFGKYMKVIGNIHDWSEE